MKEFVVKIIESLKSFVYKNKIIIFLSLVYFLLFWIFPVFDYKNSYIYTVMYLHFISILLIVSLAYFGKDL